MNHFPETTAAIRRLARAIKAFFALKRIERTYRTEFRFGVKPPKLEDEWYGAYWGSGNNAIPASPWWRVKDYEETETGEK